MKYSEKKVYPILTFSGKQFFPLDPKPEDVDPIDIAHALGNQCRYTGHVKKFYSVAEHCVIIHDFLARTETDPEILKWALLHDADEAYLLDLAAPIKHHPRGFGEPFREAAQGILAAVAERFRLSLPEPRIVKEIDVRLRSNEMTELFPPNEFAPMWGNPLPITILNWTPVEASAQYLWRLQNHGLVCRDEKGDFHANEMVLA